MLHNEMMDANSEILCAFKKYGKYRNEEFI